MVFWKFRDFCLTLLILNGHFRNLIIIIFIWGLVILIMMASLILLSMGLIKLSLLSILNVWTKTAELTTKNICNNGRWGKFGYSNPAKLTVWAIITAKSAKCHFLISMKMADWISLLIYAQLIMLINRIQGWCWLCIMHYPSMHSFWRLQFWRIWPMIKLCRVPWIRNWMCMGRMLIFMWLRLRVRGCLLVGIS